MTGHRPDDKSTHRPFWRLPVIIGVAAAGMVLWVVVRFFW